MNNNFLLAILLFLSGWSAPAQLVPSDTPYYVHEHKNYHYIFPKLYKNHIPKAVEFNEHLREYYEKSFSWKLEERASLVLASERNQIANGFATVSPNTLTFFYPSGFPILDTFASPNWFSVLLAHESAHLYQLDAKSKVSSLFKSILGNPIFIITPYVPVFIHPNQLGPGFMLEGNAVMNESTHGLGGRLFSGEVRALVYQLLAHDKVTNQRLFNDHLEFPYFTEKYLVGGYFNAFLAKKYGIAKANQFFLEQGQRFINPLIVNKTFRNHFGKSYSQLLREFRFEYQDIVKKQKRSQEPPLYKGYRYARMNSDKDRVWLMVQEDLKTPPYLTVIDKQKMQWTQEKIDLPMGKVHWVDGEPTVTASRRHSVKYMENSLYGEGWKFYPEYRSQIVQDFRTEKKAHIDGRTQFFENELYINDKRFESVHSSVVLSNSGEPIYFKQSKEQRALYLGQQPIASFQGYYGYPLEETSSGGINFIAATEYGSGLFQAKDGLIKRLHPSDLILDARQIQGNQYLVTEVTHKGYEYKVVAVSELDELPAFYNYSLEAEGKTKTEELANELQSHEPESNDKDNYRNYSVLGDLRYSSTFFEIAAADPGGVQGYISSNFVDPLFYNAINLTYQRILDSNSASFQYIFNRYVFKPYIGYLYNEDRIRVLNGLEEDSIFYYDQRAFTGFTLPLFIWRRWSSDWNTDLAWERSDLLADRFEESVEITNAFRLNYSQGYPLAYSAYRYLGLTLAHQNIQSSLNTNPRDDIYLGQLTASGDLGYENYLTVQYTEGVSENNNIRLSYSQALNNDFVRVYRLFPEDSIDVNHVRAIEATYKRPFDTPYYFTRFPFSFRRSAIYLEGGYYDTETNTALDSWFVDYRYGVELEALFIHRLPMRIKFGAQHTTEAQQSGLLFQISSEKQF